MTSVETNDHLKHLMFRLMFRDEKHLFVSPHTEKHEFVFPVTVPVSLVFLFIRYLQCNVYTEVSAMNHLL